MKLTVGVDLDLEAQADALIFAETSKTFKPSEKDDVITPWKEWRNRTREVLVSHPDRAARQGMYHRAYAREWGCDWRSSRFGIAQFLPKPGKSRLSAWMIEQGLNPGPIRERGDCSHSTAITCGRGCSEFHSAQVWGWTDWSPPVQRLGVEAVKRRPVKQTHMDPRVRLDRFRAALERLDPRVVKEALSLAGGEVRRLYIRDRDVVVRNRPW